MAQFVDIQYQEKAESKPLNRRFLDITGPCILQGFRTVKGTRSFGLSLSRGMFNENIAVTPSGAKVEETEDLENVVLLRPNTDLNKKRVDSLYMVYKFGKPDAVAVYEVIEGTEIPAENPNRLTHLLLAYIYVPTNYQDIRSSDIVMVPYGFSRLEVAGSSIFHGPVTFDHDVHFNSNVTGIGNFPGGKGTFIEKLPLPIVAIQNQTDFFLPSEYEMATNTLFVYLNGKLLPPSEWMEVTNTQFRLFDPCSAGDRVWAFWYTGLNAHYIPEHAHDDLYHRKYEVANRAVRTVTDYFAGTNGRLITHNLNTTNYTIIAVTPIEKTRNAGEISVDKRENEIVVYNDGTYRGKFDLSYILNAPFPEVTEDYQALDYTVESNKYNDGSAVYEEVYYRRRNGTIFLKTTLYQPDTYGRFTRVRCNYFSNDGVQIYKTKVWALTFDQNGKIQLRSRII